MKSKPKEKVEVAAYDEEEEEVQSEDDFDVVINTDKPTVSPVTAAATVTENISGSKATIDLVTVGMLNGKSIFEVDLDDNLLFSLQPGEERPWRKAGADPTDYFNYGFTEQTWRQYCVKQRMLREEYSGQAGKRIAILDQMGHATSKPAIPALPGMPGLPPPDFLMQHLAQQNQRPEQRHDQRRQDPRQDRQDHRQDQRQRSPQRRSPSPSHYQRRSPQHRSSSRRDYHHRSPSPKRRR